MTHEALRNAKRIIREQIRINALTKPSSNFCGYQKSYFQTNENINFYMQLANLNRNSDVLTVLASGDHAFNLITDGVKNIDTFDINKLSEYVAFGLKKAMILKYNYLEYLVIYQKLMNYDIKLEELSDIIMSLTPYMDQEYRYFWRKLVDYNYRLQKRKMPSLNLIYLICTGVNSATTHINNNKYLTDEYYYEELRRNLQHANLTFKDVDAINLASEFYGKQYDAIFLSNIPDYFCNYFGQFWEKHLLLDYMDDLEILMKEQGIIFANYIFELFDGYTYNRRAVRDSLVFFDDLDDSFELLEVPVNVSDKIIDGMVLKRVNKQ